MKNLAVSFILCLVYMVSYSNNIIISDVNVTGTTIHFNLSWDNSWRGGVNRDAAWVFVKYLTSNNEWGHVIINSNGNTCPSDCEISTVTDGTGVFVYSSMTSNWSGNNNFQNISLSWNISANAIVSTVGIVINVFAIEMVYVPQGCYYLGDGTVYNPTPTNPEPPFCLGHFRQENNQEPVLISDIATIVKSESTYPAPGDDNYIINTGILIDGDNGIDKDGNVTVDNQYYPTGYQSFYSMKYEISQGQYADFLNFINPSQATSRFPNNYGNHRNTIKYSPTLSKYIADSPELACNYLDWMDGCAYSDWAGLRPMTELEYEKACRGQIYPVAGEYAWGNNNICGTDYTLSNTGSTSELVSNPCTNTGNVNYPETSFLYGGPLRCGIFAASAVNKTRIETGSTIYGIMEMSGNLDERVVSLGNYEGRSFTGLHGDGYLSLAGNANVLDWPGTVSGEVTGANGSGFRGGTWCSNNILDDIRVSDRDDSSYTANYRDPGYGFRCVRSAW
ncbi:MAG: formylglycine-generating enzyme family protein [Bacteroidales bacterium]|nr:formylglycine-generating enzyme family protein [Bacteroidales bacterium]